MKHFVKALAVGGGLLSLIATASATTTWNYLIADAGGGNSQLTWNVTGDLTTPTGMVLLQPQTYLDIPITAPGIFNDSYAANGAIQNLPAPEGSLFYILDIYFPMVGFVANNAPGGANDTFSLVSTPIVHGKAGFGPGSQFNYLPATQSVVLPIDYAEFNPGSYQSQIGAYSPSFTVNLTIGAVPEPSTLALVVVGALGVLAGSSHRVLPEEPIRKPGERDTTGRAFRRPRAFRLW